MALLFESEPCGRCGGSGRYSFNMTHGSRCYGCGGSGERLTKRGAVAQQFFRDLLTVETTELKVGDRVVELVPTMSGAVGNRGAEVVSIELAPEGEPGTTVKTSSMTHLVGRSSKWRLIPSKEERARKVEEALAFQATLTKAGTVRKRAAR